MPTPAAALERLQAGNHRFVEGKREHTYRERERREALVGGQHPFAVVVGCSDSRVPPELVFDQGLGDLFTVRVAGNTVDDALVVGTIEYAVTHAGCDVVVVLGHDQCGAVRAAVDSDGRPLPGHLSAVVDPIVPVVQSLPDTPPDELLDAAIDANIRRAIDHLRANELLADAIRRDALSVVGRRYRLASGIVENIG
ncbi:MAG TPA: carbonic anhydrase [Acidimicrobiia bacterium]|jgi:carbonic anhydrase